MAGNASDFKPARVMPPATPGPSGLATMAVGLVLVGALYVGREVFIPLVLAVLLSFVLAPIIAFLRRFYVPRIAAVIATVVLALGIIVSIGGLMGVQIAQLGGQLPRYQQTMQKKLEGLQNGVYGRFAQLVHTASTAVQESATPPGSTAAPAARSDPATPNEKPLLVRLPEQEPSPLYVARQIIEPVLSPVTTTGIVLIVVVFLLMQREDLRDRMIRLFGSSDLHRTTLAMDDAAARLSTYFLTQLGINTAFGIIIGIGLWAIGVPSPILWGVFALLMRFVPYIGAALSALLPIALAAAVSPDWHMAIYTAVLFGVTEAIIGQVIEPLLYGHSTGLSPFAVIVSALFWAWLWGPVGLILSTPFTVLLVVLGRHVEHLEFLDVLLGDRPALTPVENFYQRILAGDPDEARDYAERLLKDRPLISYYDDVAIKGLQLASRDARRGAISEEKLETIKSAVDDLILDLATYEDASAKSAEAKGNADVPTLAEQALPSPTSAPALIEPEALTPPWDATGSIACIAGPGPLDYAAAEILAQLLEKNGLHARVVSHDAVSRRTVERLDGTGTAMACIMYLELTGAPSHLRYLIQRLRVRFPGAKLLVGLYAEGDEALKVVGARTSLGADHFASTLREVVERCLDEARTTVTRAAA